MPSMRSDLIKRTLAAQCGGHISIISELWEAKKEDHKFEPSQGTSERLCSKINITGDIVHGEGSGCNPKYYKNR